MAMEPNDHKQKKTFLWAILALLRPNQWTKNLVVLAAFFFASWDPGQHLEQGSAFIALTATILFCIVSSGIYVINDIADRKADARHPRKQFRPIAAGIIPLPLAWILGTGLLTAGSLASWWLSPPFGFVVFGYILIQLLYSLILKQIALIDILLIAIGFVLRAVAGAVVLDVTISPWLLLCTFLLALFLALCKRRYEKNILQDAPAEQRISLEKYDERLLDQLIAIISAATIVSYSIYTLSPDTLEKFGTARLGFTIPFVMFGIFRYLDLVYRHNKGDRPEKILLTDIPVIVTLVLYVAALTVIFLTRQIG